MPPLLDLVSQRTKYPACERQSTRNSTCGYQCIASSIGHSIPTPVTPKQLSPPPSLRIAFTHCWPSNKHFATPHTQPRRVLRTGGTRSEGCGENVLADKSVGTYCPAPYLLSRTLSLARYFPSFQSRSRMQAQACGGPTCWTLLSLAKARQAPAVVSVSPYPCRTGALNTDWMSRCTSAESGPDPASMSWTRPPSIACSAVGRRSSR